MLIYRLAAAFDKAQLPYAIVGGYAVALHGAVRGTVDVDVAIGVSKSSFVAAEKALRKLGLESKLPVHAEQIFNFREEYIRDRNLIAWNFYNPNKPIESVDILLTEDVVKMKVERIRTGDVTLKVASIPDLIRMKKSSGRPQDLSDIEALKKLEKL
jgi:hypothetical protein